MLRADVETTLAVTPAFTSTQDDGTVLADYASVDADGKPEYLSVRYRGGKVIGRSRIPRAAPAPVAFNGGGCENGVCALPRSRP